MKEKNGLSLKGEPNGDSKFKIVPEGDESGWIYDTIADSSKNSRQIYFFFLGILIYIVLVYFFHLIWG